METKAELAGQSTKGRALRRARILEMCRGPALSTQQRTDHHIHVRKLPKARERTPLKDEIEEWKTSELAKKWIDYSEESLGLNLKSKT